MKKVIFTTVFVFAVLFASAQIKVYSGGKAEVGSTSITPSQALDVNGNIALPPSSVLGSGNGYGCSGCAASASLQLYNASNGNTTLNNSAYAIQFQTSSTARLHITSGGNIGIGTTSPNVKLDVPGNVWLGSTSSSTLPDGNSNYFLIVGNNVSSSNQGEIHAVGNTSSGNVGQFCVSNYNISATDKRITIMIGATDGANNSGKMQFYTANSGTLGERMRITSSGKIGINTTSPGFFLDVNGDINCGGSSTSTTNAYYLGTNKFLWHNGVTTSIFAGVGAGGTSTTGAGNTLIGGLAGATLTSSKTNNTCIGYGADVSSNFITGSTALGYGAIVNASNKVYIGNSGSTSVIGGPVGWSNLSDARFKNNVSENVKGLEFIKKLRPVIYNLDTKKYHEFLMKNMPDSIKILHRNGMDYTASSNIVHTGFIAQEVEQAANACNYTFDGLHVPADTNDNYSLVYAQFVVPLVKAVQELSKTQDSLKALIANCCSSSHRTMQNNADTTQDTAPTIHQLELANNTVLFQNFPNPFGEGTTIKYFIPDNISNAEIIFLDEFGNKLKEYKVEEKGMGQLNISTPNLSSGVYSYSLIVNGKVIDTKKMMKNK